MSKHNKQLTTYSILGLCGVALVLAASFLHTSKDSSAASRGKAAMPRVLAAETTTNSVYLETPNQSVIVGNQFAVTIRVNSLEPVNAVSTKISYPMDKLSVVSIEDAGSGFDVDVEENSSNGVITVTKGAFNPLTGNQLLATIIFKANTIGPASLTVMSDSQLMSYANNTNILSVFGLLNMMVVSNTVTVLPTATPTKTPTPTPAVNSSFTGEYYDNTAFLGSPVMTRFDPRIAFDWGRKSPVSSIPNDKFSVRWKKNENFAGGNYVFTVKHDDGMRIFLDGTQIYSRWGDQSAKTRTFSRQIPAGIHEVKVEYYENRGRASAFAAWKRQ